MQDKMRTKISAEMSKIIESTSENYSDEIRNYISNGRIFSDVDNYIISNIWIELMLYKTFDYKESNNTLGYIEIEHFLRGLALPYDRFIESGGNICSILNTYSHNEFDFFNEKIEIYNDIDLDLIHKYYEMDKKCCN